MSNINRTKLLLDTATFTGFLIAMDPHSTGIAVHEWLAIALGATVVVHLLMNWNWIVEMGKRLLTGKGLNGSKLNYILNWSLFIDGIVILLSGLMISESVMPTLGITFPSSFTWRGLHEFSTNLSLVIMGLHVAMHWKWITTTFKRLFVRETDPTVISNIVIDRKDVRA